jgi:L-amino acid N-acyltransferase YncA
MEVLPIALRSCTERDAEILESARNDPVSAAFSRRGALSLEEITNDYILNGKKHTYIITAGSESLGYAVLEEEALHCDFMEISIAILPNARGRGIAGRALELTHQQAQTQFLAVRGIHAWIHDSNVVSRRLFTKKEYVATGERNIVAGQSLSQYELTW